MPPGDEIYFLNKGGYLKLLFLTSVLGALILLALLFFWGKKGGKEPEKKPGFIFFEQPVPELKEEYSSEISVPAPGQGPAREPDLPSSYGVDRLVLLARDPYWLYAYWEITATKQEEFSAAYGPFAWVSSQPVLRVYDVTATPGGEQKINIYADIGINEEADNWHINVGEPDHTFFVDLGRRLPDGRFIPLLRSNFVTTPRASLSERTDEEWMWIEGIYRSYRYHFGYGSPMFAEEMAQKAGIVPLGIGSPGQWQKQPD
ncbi:MAG: DUF4912 domain-containing protein [Desulfotomaculales bacterium]